MKVNTVGKSISKVKRAYLAGLIDGDGAVMAYIERHDEKRFGFRVRMEIKVTQMHEKDVQWIKSLTGIGYVRKNGRTYEWIVRDQRVIQWLIAMIAPFVRIKRQQINCAKKILKYPVNTKNDLMIVARLADTLSSYNVRSKYRRKNFATMI